MKPVAMLPNLLTLGNSACGLLAISKGVDALAYSGENPETFYQKMEAACGLIFLGMVFDALDGKVARLTKSFSDFGAQLDSLADLLTFGVAPAILAKVMIEHEGPLMGYVGSPRLHFIAAASFALMAILRLARFNLETEHDEDAHKEFRGLPSPGAAGAVASTLLVYILFREPALEIESGTPTPVGRVMGWLQDIDWTPVLAWVPLYLVFALPALGLLMVSRVRYVHATALLTRERGNFLALVLVVFVAMGLYAAPGPFLFVAFNGFALFGVVRWVLTAWRQRSASVGARS